MSPPEVSSDPFNPEFASPGEWAAMYRACGLQVVPAFRAGEPPRSDPQWKRPIVKWRIHENERIPDETFDRWYGATGEHSGRMNMGVLTGRCSAGAFVIDLDTYKSPDAGLWWQGVLDEHCGGFEPETWRQLSGGGGRGLFFRAPEGWTPPTNRTRIGVDIRGQGGFIMTSPSIHESGRTYAFEPGWEPWAVDLAEAPAWLCAAVDELVRVHGGKDERAAAPAGERTVSPGTDFDGFGARVDGREDQMARLVWGVMVDWWRECPIRPTAPEAQAKMREAYQVYERMVKSRLVDPAVPKSVLLDREGRGAMMFAAKWQTALDQWNDKIAAHGKEPKLVAEPHEFAGGQSAEVSADDRSFTERVEAAAGPPPKPEAGPDGEDWNASAEPQGARQRPALEYLDIAQIKALPDTPWLVDEVVPSGSIGLVYGAPGTFKTFVCLSLGLHVAYGLPVWWWGRRIRNGGLVVYVAKEGVSGLKTRIMAWQDQYGITDDTGAFVLVRSSLNFMEAEDVGALIRTIQDGTARFHQQPALVFVDTVSRVLPGADENLQKEMTLFIAACDAVKDRFGATVIGVHHAGKSGALRGSTVIPGGVDFMFKLTRPDDANRKRIDIHCDKQKDGADDWHELVDMRPVEVFLPGRIDAARESLVAMPVTAEDLAAAAEPASGTNAWPDMATCKRILAAIAKAWTDGEPWSNTAQSKRTGRYAPDKINREFGIDAKFADEMILEWLNTDILKIEIADKRNDRTGLKVIGSIG